MSNKEEAHKDSIILCAATLCLKGNLMGGPETEKLRETLQIIINSGAKKIILELGEVKWINGAGINSLVACQKSLKKINGQLLLATPSAKVKELLKITKHEKSFQIIESWMTYTKLQKIKRGKK